MKVIYLVFILFFSGSVLAFDENLILTENEQQWLKNHLEIKIASDASFPPIEWLAENGQYQGIAMDYLKLIEQKLPVKFIRVKKSNWSNIIQGFKEQKIDLLSAVAKNKIRQQYMLFTRPYLSFPAVIISSHQYQHLDELKGKKVGVVTDSYWDDLLTHSDFNIQIVRIDSGEIGVELTSMGAIDAMISNLATVSYAVKKMGISNLNIVHVPRQEHRRLELSFGIRKDWPELQGILQKALDSIAKEEKDSIYNKWIKLQPISFWQSTRFWYSVIAISLIIIISISIILLWNRTLKLRVRERTEELKKAQTQLIYAEKMESIGRLSAGVAHEVKNPLAILQMSIDYLKGEQNNDTIKTILDDMEDAVFRADTVIKSLLDFSREKELQMQMGNINEVIQNSIRLIEHEIRQNNITLKIELQNNLSKIPMDKNRLQQVFINLFMNAIQAMGPVGKQTSEQMVLQIKSGNDTIKDPWLITQSDGLFNSGQQAIQIIILDSGTGLEKQNEQVVFEPFFTTKSQGEGTGLGLSVSKTIIGLHHGMIVMRNRLDDFQGAEVIILFPVQEENNG